MMSECNPLYYPGDKFFTTSKGNRIGRQVLIKGGDRILIAGKSIVQNNCVLRGDLAQIEMGYHCLVREDCIIRPCFTKQQGRLKYTKMTIGSNVCIETNCIVTALKIGNNVQIGKNCVIGHRA